MTCTCRYTNIATMGDIQRGNKLAHPRSANIEYAIHGKFSRAEDDANGCFGCYYIPLKKLYETFKDRSAVNIEQLIDVFEKELVEARKEALDACAVESPYVPPDDDVE